MARATTTRTTRAKSTKPADEAVPTEAPEEAPVTTTVADETVTETEAPAAEVPAETTDEKPAEPDLTEFNTAVQAALDNADTTTGQVPDGDLSNVKVAYRNLDGLKAKNAAKKDLVDRLRNSVNEGNIPKAQAVMHVTDAVQAAGTAPKAQADRTPKDPTEAFIERLTVLNIAYNLANSDVPDGLDGEQLDAARKAATDKVGELSEQAEKYYTWLSADGEDKGDEPEVNPLVKRSVKFALGKGSSVGRGPSTPHEGPRGNTARHIQLVFKDQPVGTFMKVAEIAKTKTTEYPDKPVSAGAINARLKSNTPIEGIESTTDESGKAGARKTAVVDL